MNSGVSVGGGVKVKVGEEVGKGVNVSVGMNVEVGEAVSLGEGSGLTVHVGMKVRVGGGVAVSESPLHPKMNSVIARKARAERSEPVGEWRRSVARRNNLMVIQIYFQQRGLLHDWRYSQ